MPKRLAILSTIIVVFFLILIGVYFTIKQRFAKYTSPQTLKVLRQPTPSLSKTVPKIFPSNDMVVQDFSDNNLLVTQGKLINIADNTITLEKDSQKIIIDISNLSEFILLKDREKNPSDLSNPVIGTKSIQNLSEYINSVVSASIQERNNKYFGVKLFIVSNK